MANKDEQYATKLVAHIQEIFRPGHPDHINMKEFSHPDNYTAFMHAMATLVPLHFHNNLTKQDKTQLEFNHLANSLIFKDAKEKAVQISKS